MINLEEVTKTFVAGKRRVVALNAVTLNIRPGELVVVRGPSGSGKTTLLLTMAAMQRPTSGQVRVDGQDLQGMNARERARFRAQNIGFVFQMFHLIPYLNVLENVILAAGAAGVNDARAKAEKVLEQLGLQARILHMPSELSAGEKQRTAVARALLNDPKVLLADEPTGNLDPENAAAVFSYLSAFRDKGGTVIVATHETEVERIADRVVSLRQGNIV